MKNKELFDRTITILVKSYFNNTLEYMNCKACAVGNIIAGNLGANIDSSLYSGEWFRPFKMGGCGRDGVIKHRITQSVMDEVNITGYSLYELADIEKAFADGCFQFGGIENYYNGLMFVVDAIMLIHEANEAEVEQAKAQFVRV